MKELKKQIKEGNFNTCYLLYGAESYLVQLYSTRLKNAMLHGEGEMMNMDLFSQKNAVVSSIIGAAQTLPFLSEYRLVIVKDSGLFEAGRKNDSEAMAQYIPKIPVGTCILFIEDAVDKRGKLYKAVAKCGSAVEMKPLSENELIKFLISESKKSGVILENRQAQYFCHTVGGSMDYMLLELAKLTAYRAGEGSVSNEDIDAVCTKSLELRIFDLVDACADKNSQLALEIYRNLLQRKESPLMVLAMLYRQFKMIYQCKALSNANIGLNDIALKTGLRDFMIRGSLKQGGRFTLDALKKALEQCLQIDVDIKIGKINGDLAVEMLLLEYSN